MSVSIGKIEPDPKTTKAGSLMTEHYDQLREWARGIDPKVNESAKVDE